MGPRCEPTRGPRGDRPSGPGVCVVALDLAVELRGARRAEAVAALGDERNRVLSLRVGKSCESLGLQRDDGGRVGGDFI